MKELLHNIMSGWYPGLSSGKEEELREVTSMIRESGELIERTTCDGSIDIYQFGFINITIYPAGLILEILFHRPYPIPASATTKVTIRPGKWRRGVEIRHSYKKVGRPIYLACRPDDSLARALVALAEENGALVESRPK